jgi:beta-glucosidase-like glycosyl hydrolase
MPSLIGDTGYNGISGVTANYLKAKPSTRFATRQLAFVEIEVTGCHTNPYLSNSLYSRAIRGVQAVAEVYAVGLPATNKFMVVIAQDTDGADDNNDGLDGGDSDSQSMTNAVSASVQGSGDLELTIAATYKHMLGAGFTTGVKSYFDETVAGNNPAV